MAERLCVHVDEAQRHLARTNGLCERCQAKGLVRLADVVDHETPLAKGGSDEDSNTRNLCHPCHLEVTAEQFGYRKPNVAVTGTDGWPVEG